jgi:acyl-CoA reductase-like NAD-dependent aldehyde dehydrogenase
MYCEHARKQPLLVLLLLQCLEVDDMNDVSASPLTLCYTSYPTIPNINQCSQLHYASVASAESNRLAAAAAAAAAAASRLPAHSTSLCLLPHNELLEAGRLAGAVTQVVQLGTTDLKQQIATQFPFPLEQVA